jgi:hypothetical protein
VALWMKTRHSSAQSPLHRAPLHPALSNAITRNIKQRRASGVFFPAASRLPQKEAAGRTGETIEARVSSPPVAAGRLEGLRCSEELSGRGHESFSVIASQRETHSDKTPDPDPFASGELHQYLSINAEVAAPSTRAVNRSSVAGGTFVKGTLRLRVGRLSTL